MMGHHLLTSKEKDKQYLAVKKQYLEHVFLNYILNYNFFT